MKIHSESRIAHPQPLVYAAFRDRLPEVVPYLPDIAEISVVSREDGPDGPKLHNRWRSDRDIPSIVQRFLKPEMLCWDDHAQWLDGEGACTWRLIVPAFPTQVQCSGRNTFISDGDHTRVVMTGELAIQANKIPGVPRLLARTVAPQVEKFIVALITPNLERVNGALGEYLDAQ